MRLLDATFLNLIKIVCERCGGRGRINYFSGFTVYLNALQCPDCDRSTWR